MQPTTYALLIKEENLEKLYSFYEENRCPCANRYVSFYAEGDGYNVFIYSKAHNGAHKVVFQGNKAKQEAEIWNQYSLEPASFTLPKKPLILKKESHNVYPQIGSDEVGTGDFFGPVVVVASYVKNADLARLEELGVTDSKKMGDEHILEIGPTLIKEFPYSALTLENSKYNELYAKGENLNSIKAKMHNRALLNLKAKFPDAKPYQDQFAEPELYYSYLKCEKEILGGITFKTKGELSFPSVALASVIARYAFLERMKKMGEKYSFLFPFGAGSSVDERAKEFTEKYGYEELKNVAKMNFGNVRKIGG